MSFPTLINSLPSSPKEWQKYVSLPALSKIPDTTSIIPGKVELVHRDVFVDLGAVNTGDSDLTFVYSDVLSLPSGPTVRLPLADLAPVSLYTRVITSDGPVTLELAPATTNDAVVIIFASHTDHLVSVSAGGQSKPQPLNLGISVGNIGAAINLKDGELSVQYIHEYSDQDLNTNGNLAKALATQLRIASVLFWLQPAIASSLAQHVVRATCRSKDVALLNIQASALYQQLRAAQMTGPGVSYAPVLKLEYYKNTVGAVLDAGSEFQKQYDRFVDNGARVEDQLKAWDSMLDQAQKTITMQQRLAESTKAKWDSAKDILSKAQNNMRRHQLTLEAKAVDFRLGIQAWKVKKTLDAVANIIMATVTFALAIGTMCVGDPGPAAAAPAKAAQAIEQVAEAAEAATRVTQVITKDTLQNIEKVVKLLKDLMEATVSNVRAIVSSSDKGAGSLKPFPVLEDGNEDLAALVGVAAWDKWTLDTEDQMSFAVSQSIDGASSYLLELRKHAIDGKLTTQASAQAIKAGQEYVQVQLALQLAQADLERLRKLRKEFKQDKEKIETARLHFYDRLDAMRTSALIELRSIVWAYKFYTLADSSVQLDPSKRMEEYKADMALLLQEVERWEEGFASDKSPIHFLRDIDDPHFKGIGPGIVESLKQDDSASFALAPRLSGKPNVLPFPSGPFFGGNSFRIFGMRVYLVGAIPKATALDHDGTALIWLSVNTSGVYADIRKDGQVLAFTSMPQSRQFKYRVDKLGEPIQNRIEVDSINSPAGYHMDPPPFTQWSISIREPEKLNLAGLTGIKLEWQGRAYLDGA